MYVVYILECNNGALYTGVTTNVERRFAEHQAGKGARFTRAHPPKKIVYTETCADRSSAQKREAEIKALSRAQKESLLIKCPRGTPAH